MGLFDFLFGNKKEKERLEKERLAEQERIRLAEEKRIAAEREKRLEDNRRKEAERQRIVEAKKQDSLSAKESSQTKSVSNSFGKNSSALQLNSLVHECLELESKGHIQELQNNLFALFKNFNCPGGGKLITTFNEKENLALCFSFLLQYDWMHDSDLREVFAENGFYCIVEHIMHQPNGRQGQAEAMIILFTLLCVGRDSLKPKVQDIINKARQLGNPIFHQDDYRIGAQNVIDQISLMAISGVRDLGPAGGTVMSKICEKYDGFEFFQNTVTRKDLMKYDPSDVFMKMKFIHDVIESVLNEM